MTSICEEKPLGRELKRELRAAIEAAPDVPIADTTCAFMSRHAGNPAVTPRLVAKLLREIGAEHMAHAGELRRYADAKSGRQAGGDA